MNIITLPFKFIGSTLYAIMICTTVSWLPSPTMPAAVLVVSVINLLVYEILTRVNQRDLVSQYVDVDAAEIANAPRLLSLVNDDGELAKKLTIEVLACAGLKPCGAVVVAEPAHRLLDEPKSQMH